MVREALSRRMEPGTTLAPTLNPTLSTNVGSADVLAASSAGVRKYTPVSFTPSAIRNPTLPTISSAPTRNLWPAFMVCSGGRRPLCRAQTFASVHRYSRPCAPADRRGRFAAELVYRGPVLLVLRPAGGELGVHVLEEASVRFRHGPIVPRPPRQGAPDHVPEEMPRVPP